MRFTRDFVGLVKRCIPLAFVGEWLSILCFKSSCPIVCEIQLFLDVYTYLNITHITFKL